MDYYIGDYKLNCEFDPKILDNSSRHKKEINDIGFIYNCVFKQREAFLFSLEAIRKIYPNSKIYVVSDGGDDYSFIENEQVKFKMDADTVSPLKGVNKFNYRYPKNQLIIKNGMKATLDRLCEGIKYCDYPEWFCMTEPDVFIRGKISYPINAELLGSRVNYAWYKKDWLKSFIEINKLLQKINGSIPILRWGSVPVIGKTETFLRGLDIYEKNSLIFDSLSEKYPAIGGFDLFLPLIFALAGEQEIFSSDYTECIRNPNWKKSSATVIHQYREYYKNEDFYNTSSANGIIKNLKSQIKKILKKIDLINGIKKI